MVKTPTRPSEESREFARRKTRAIFQDQRKTNVESQATELTDIQGVGRSLARKLRSAGFRNIEQVQRASINQLTAVEGVGEAKADRLIDAAFDATLSERETLLDIDGVGKKTAIQLENAGISEPYELRGKSQREIASIDGIGPKQAARIRADVEFEAPAGAVQYSKTKTTTETGTEIFTEGSGVDISRFETTPDAPGFDGAIEPAANTIFTKGPDRQEAIEAHAERSPQARRADESFNAPIMLDVDTWKQNKGEYDYPGVDTIPRSRKLERTQEQVAIAREMGALSDLQAEPDDATEGESRGQFDSHMNTVGVDTSFRQSEQTLAHEIGHAIDEQLGRPSGENARGVPVGGIFEDTEVRQEAAQLSAQRRGTELESDIPEDDDLLGELDDSDYLQSNNEIFADLYAEMTLNPRRAKREAPKAFRAVQEEIGMDVGFF